MSETLMTGEELLHRPDLEPCELVNGKVVPGKFHEVIHGLVLANLGGELGTYVNARHLGSVAMGGCGVYTRRNPDTVRATDLLFISNERFARVSDPDGYLDIPPELVIEVMSPEDRWSYMMAKFEDYLSAGVDALWAVDPERRKVFAYRSLTEVRCLSEGDVLSDEVLFPGLLIPLSGIFED